jgi:hypothetical protein
MAGRISTEEVAAMPDLPVIYAQLRIRPWISLVGSPRFAPQSCYVECCYLPVLGPSTTWLYRHLGCLVAVAPEGMTIDVAELAVEHGLGQGVGPHAPISRSLRRLVQFNLARWEVEDLVVRPTVPALAPRQIERLTARMQRVEAELRRQAGQQA